MYVEGVHSEELVGSVYRHGGQDYGGLEEAAPVLQQLELCHLCQSVPEWLYLLSQSE